MTMDGLKMKPSFRFVVATRKEEHQILPIDRCLTRIKWEDEYDVTEDIAYQNINGLPTVYNKAIEKALSDGIDYLICVHDDIWLNDVMVFDKIVSASKSFDVIGVCGGKAWNFNHIDRPIIWTHASKGKGMSGFMAHAADEKQSGVKFVHDYNGRSIFSSNYGNSPSRTLTLDGCFICLTNAAMKMGLRFDERFSFHFYDMDLCFSAYVKGISVGTAPILLTHESLGMSVSQPEFMESQQKFLEKWFKKQCD